ncbi:MAG TPA: SDR family NAD(P)-dependent oxidoreductase [Polyangiales bacterium]
MSQSVLITGANSGLGFEAAAQFATGGFTRVVLGCRSLEKATAARDALEARTGLRHIFEVLELDLSRLEAVRAATRALAKRGSLDVLVLNAGVLPGKELVHTEDGIEITSAASLTGHHVLTLGLLDRGLLAPRARIVIAGSEGARGDAPGMKPLDLRAFASEHFSGKLEAAVHAVLTMQPPAVHHWSTTYCTSKALVALWAKALALHLPKGMAVYAVSPGNVPSTNAVRHQSWSFRAMIKLADVIGPLMGMASSVSTGARRYWDAARLADEVSGEFFASPKGKLVGPLTVQRVPHLTDAECAAACWDAVLRATAERQPRLSAA